MGFRKVINNIDQLRELVAGWDDKRASDVGSLEISMALDKVKRIYESLRFPSDEHEEEVEAEAKEEVKTETVEVVAAVAAEETPIEKPIEKPKVEVSFSIGVVDAPMPEPEPIPEEPKAVVVESVAPSISLETIVASSPEPIKEEEADEHMAAMQRKRERYKKIMSLYTDPVEEPVELPASLQRRAMTPKSSGSSSGNSDHVGLLADELFGGDRAALSEALLQLNGCASLDDAIIYISDNYSWDGNSEAAQLIYQLLQKHFADK